MRERFYLNATEPAYGEITVFRVQGTVYSEQPSSKKVVQAFLLDN